MAFFSLGLHRALQPWARAGISQILCDELTVEHVRAACKPMRNAPPQTITASSTQAGTASGTSPQQRSEAQGAPSNNTTQASRPRTTAAPPISVTDTGASAPNMPQPLPVEQWPASWRERLAKSPPKPLIVWTYIGLEKDLAGQADPARGAYLRRLLADLKLPGGSHAFWPMTQPGETTHLAAPKTPVQSEPSEHPAHTLFFHSGIAALHPQTVIFLCDAIPEALGLPLLGLNSPRVLCGRRYVRFRDIRLLVQDAQEGLHGRHGQLVQFLKSLHPTPLPS